MYGIIILILIGVCVNTLQMKSSSLTRKRNTLRSIGAQGRSINVPPECQHQTYCTVKPDDYPEELFENMFKDKCTNPYPMIMRDATPLRRIGTESDDCLDEPSFWPFYQVQSQGVWYTVVQAPKVNYVQRVRLETCKGGNQSCFGGTAYLDEKIKTKCVQEYTTWNFLVLTGERNNTYTVRVNLPMCCSCQYEVIGY